MISRRLRRAILTASILSLLPLTGAQAQTNWQALTGSWGDSVNWDNGVPNGVTADARISVTGNSQIFLDGGTYTVNRLRASSSTGSLIALVGGTLVMGGAAPQVEVVSGELRLDPVATTLRLDANTTFNIGSSFLQEAGAVIAGAGGLIKTGAGTLELSSANSYSGGTTVSGGVVSISNDNQLGAAAGSLTFNGGTLYLRESITSSRNIELQAGGGTFTYAGATLDGVISGTGPLTIVSDQQYYLNGVNTYVGDTFLSFDANVHVRGASSFGAAGNTVNINSARIIADADADAVVAQNVQLDGGALMTAEDGATLDFQGVISGSGKLDLSTLGTGLIRLQANNTNTGDVQVYTGTTLELGGANSFGTGTNAVVLEGNLTLRTLASFTLARDLRIDYPVTFDVAAGTTLTESGVISGQGALVKEGAGTLVLTGANTYDASALAFDATLVNTGTLQLSGAAARINHTSQDLVVASGATFEVLNGAQAATQNIGVSGTATVNGAGSLLSATGSIFVGTGVSNTAFTVSGGGTLTAGANLFLGSDAGTRGLLTVTGTGSSADIDGSTFVGSASSSGYLEVNSGADYTTGNLYLRAASGGPSAEVLVTGSGTSLQTGFLEMSGASSGDSLLTISAGASLTTTSNALLYNHATVNVTGAGSQWRADGLVQILNGAAVTFAQGAQGDFSPNAGSPPFGALTVAGGLTIQDAGTLVAATGRAEVTGTGNLQISGGGQLTSVFNSSVRDTATVTISGVGSRWSNAGDLSVVNSGLINVQGSGQLENERVFIDGANARVVVRGANTLWLSHNEVSIAQNSGGSVVVAEGASMRVDNAGNSSTGFIFLGDRAGASGSLTIGGLDTDGTTILSAGFIDAGSIQGTYFNSPHDGRAQVNFLHSSPSYTFDTAMGGNLAVNHYAGATKLRAVNTHTGGTNFNGGRVDVVDNTALGQVTTGAGEAGDLNFNGGVLFASGSFSTNRDTNLGVNAAVGGGGIDVGSGFTLTHTGVISGVGGLRKFGDGVLVLSGTNAYSGGTIINDGIVSVEEDANLGAASGGIVLDGGSLRSTGTFTTNRAIAVLDGGGVDVIADETLTAAGVLSGAAGEVLEKTGAGALVLTADNTFAGTYTITAGTLQVGNGGSTGSIVGDVVNNAAFVVNRTGTFTYGGVISGTGTFTHAGTGTTVLTGTNTYTGATAVNAGSLIVDGALGNTEVTVAAAGTLGGGGVIGGNVINNGTVAPANSQTGLTVNGNYTQNAGGRLVIRIGGSTPGSFDRLTVGGTATLTGGLTLTRANNFELQAGDYIEFLTANSRTGQFTPGQVNNEFATGTLVEGRVVYEADAVALEGVQRSFQDAVRIARRELSSDALEEAVELGFPDELTLNQGNVARALDGAVSSGTNRELITYLNSQPLGSLPGAFDLIAPEELAAAFTYAVQHGISQNTNVQRRTDELRRGASGFSASGLSMQGDVPTTNGDGGFSKDAKIVSSPVSDPRWGAFINGTGEWIDVENTGNARGYNLQSGGFTLGLDRRISDSWVVGLSGGYNRTDGDLANNGDLKIDGGKLGLYTTFYPVKGFYADLAISGGYNSYHFKRRALTKYAHGDADGGELNTLAALGYDWKVGGLTLGVTGSFQYTYVGMNDFNERGDLAALHYRENSAESVRSTVGLKASYDWQFYNVAIRPEVRAAWQHEYGDAAYAIDSALGSSGATAFTVWGPETDRETLLLGASVSVQLSERVSTYLSYDGHFNADLTYQRVDVGARVAF